MIGIVGVQWELEGWLGRNSGPRREGGDEGFGGAERARNRVTVAVGTDEACSRTARRSARGSRRARCDLGDFLKLKQREAAIGIEVGDLERAGRPGLTGSSPRRANCIQVCGSFTEVDFGRGGTV